MRDTRVNTLYVYTPTALGLSTALPGGEGGDLYGPEEALRFIFVCMYHGGSRL